VKVRTAIEKTIGAFLCGTFFLIIGALNLALGLNARWRESFMSKQFRPKLFIPLEKVSFLSSGVISLLLALLMLVAVLYEGFG
jgi:uncharacterized membrane protein YidH (DUF202 family)